MFELGFVFEINLRNDSAPKTNETDMFDSNATPNIAFNSTTVTKASSLSKFDTIALLEIKQNREPQLHVLNFHQVLCTLVFSSIQF